MSIKTVIDWLENDEEMRVPDTDWGRDLYHEIKELVAEHGAVR